MEIIIYDRNLYRLGTIENHTSLQWHRKYYECGTFELHAPATKKKHKTFAAG
ncbi:MAG: Gp37-like protein [Hominisplanchenecus sp.]